MFARLFGRFRRDRALAALEPPSDLLASQLPRPGGVETIVWHILAKNGSLSLELLVERVADRAMRVEQSRGAWNSDIAIWGPVYFRREATQAVLRMLGHSISLQDEDGGLLAVPVFPPSSVGSNTAN